MRYLFALALLALPSCATLQTAQATLAKAACDHRPEVQAAINAAQAAINSCPIQ